MNIKREKYGKLLQIKMRITTKAAKMLCYNIKQLNLKRNFLRCQVSNAAS